MYSERIIEEKVARVEAERGITIQRYGIDRVADICRILELHSFHQPSALQ